MRSMTDHDLRAAIKGSRDPRSAQAISALFGPHVVGGPTTNTTSVRESVVLLVRYWLMEKADEAGARERWRFRDLTERASSMGGRH